MATEEYLALLSSFLTSHFMYNFDELFITVLGRGLGIVFILIAGFIPKNWSSYVPVILWLLFVFFRAQISLL